MMKKYIKHILILAACVVGCFYLSSTWYQFMLIQGESMLPAYESWQLVVLEKKIKDIGYGDVVAFNCEGLDSLLIKRVVGTPGDIVQIENNKLYVNGCIVVDDGIEYAGIAASAVVLSENEYFVLGDNYSESKDSRYEKIGLVKTENIVGKVYPQRAIIQK